MNRGDQLPDTDQVQDQGELRGAARLQGQSWLSGELLFRQRRDVFDEEVPVNHNIKTALFLIATPGPF